MPDSLRTRIDDEGFLQRRLAAGRANFLFLRHRVRRHFRRCAVENEIATQRRPSGTGWFRRRFLATAACACTAVAPLGRAQDDPATFSTSVKVVDLLAVVRTKKGEIVSNLSKDDFDRTQAFRFSGGTASSTKP